MRESIVNREARKEVGEILIVCGLAARWWDNEIKDFEARGLQEGYQGWGGLMG